MNVLIIDDEPIPRQILRRYCTNFKNFTCIEEAADAMEAVDKMSRMEFDVLFLDINMPLINGIDLIKSMKSKPQIILVTAYSEYAVQAFELNVIDYLVKPVSFERFLKTVMKLNGATSPKEKKDVEPEIKLTEIKINGKTHIIPTEDIVYIEAKGNTSIFQLLSGNTLNAYATFSSILDDPTLKSFLRTHRSFAINPIHIRAFDRKRIYAGNYSVPIGDLYRSEMNAYLKKYHID